MNDRDAPRQSAIPVRQKRAGQQANRPYSDRGTGGRQTFIPCAAQQGRNITKHQVCSVGSPCQDWGGRRISAPYQGQQSALSRQQTYQPTQRKSAIPRPASRRQQQLQPDPSSTDGAQYVGTSSPVYGEISELSTQPYGSPRQLPSALSRSLNVPQRLASSQLPFNRSLNIPKSPHSPRISLRPSQQRPTSEAAVDVSSGLDILLSPENVASETERFEILEKLLEAEEMTNIMDESEPAGFRDVLSPAGPCDPCPFQGRTTSFGSPHRVPQSAQQGPSSAQTQSVGVSPARSSQPSHRMSSRDTPRKVTQVRQEEVGSFPVSAQLGSGGTCPFSSSLGVSERTVRDSPGSLLQRSVSPRSQQPTSGISRSALRSISAAPSRGTQQTSHIPRRFFQPTTRRTSLPVSATCPRMPKKTVGSAPSRVAAAYEPVQSPKRSTGTFSPKDRSRDTDESLRSFEANEYQMQEDDSLRAFEALERQLQDEYGEQPPVFYAPGEGMQELEALNRRAAEQMAGLTSGLDSQYVPQTYTETYAQASSPSSFSQPYVPFDADLSPIPHAFPSSSLDADFISGTDVESDAPCEPCGYTYDNVVPEELDAIGGTSRMTRTGVLGQPTYPQPRSSPDKRQDFYSGVEGTDFNEAGPSVYVSETTVPGALDIRVDPYGVYDSQWADTEVALTQMDMDLERATNEELRQVRECLGPDADEFSVIEALVERGAPQEVVTRAMARQEGPVPHSRLDHEEDRELRYFQEVEQLVQEEAEDIDIALKLAQLDIEIRGKDETSSIPTLKMPPKRKSYNLHGKLRAMHRQTQPFTIVEGDEPEDIQPEVAAAMMHTEERGLHLGDAPQHMFSYLFKTKPGESSSVDILPAEPGEAQVVPVRLSAQFGSNIDLEEAGSGLHEQQPNADLYSMTVGREATGQPPEHEEYIGAGSSKSSTSTQLDQTSADYYLEPRPPAYFSRVQLRGSQLPAWFPGFFEALPLEGVRLTHSPSSVMQAAWDNLQPSSFEPDTVILTQTTTTVPEVEVSG